MPGMKVYSDSATSFMATVNNTTAASLVATVTQTTAASLLAQVSNSTAASLLAQVSNSTAASLLTQVSNSTAASLLAQVSNSTAASLLTQNTLADRATNDTLTSIATTGGVTTYTRSTTRNVLELSNVCFAVINQGATNSALVKIQLSPDATTWIDDPTSAAYTLTSGSLTLLIPGKFVKYAAVAYADPSTSTTTALSIWYQTHV